MIRILMIVICAAGTVGLVCWLVVALDRRDRGRHAAAEFGPEPGENWVSELDLPRAATASRKARRVYTPLPLAALPEPLTAAFTPTRLTHMYVWQPPSLAVPAAADPQGSRDGEHHLPSQVRGESVPTAPGATQVPDHASGRTVPGPAELAASVTAAPERTPNRAGDLSDTAWDKGSGRQLAARIKWIDDHNQLLDDGFNAVTEQATAAFAAINVPAISDYHHSGTHERWAA